MASSPAGADGALAVGSTSDVVKDGIAVGATTNYQIPEEAEQAALERCRNYKPAPKAAAARPTGRYRFEEFENDPARPL